MGIFDFIKKPSEAVTPPIKTLSQEAEKVQQILNVLQSNPSVQLLDRFTDAITDSKDATVTEILLDLLQHRNPMFRGLAIQSLGLVYDSRALDAIFNAYQSSKGVYDHQERAALSIVNLITNGRDNNPAAIDYLMKIFNDNNMRDEIKVHIMRALSQFKKDNAQVEEFLIKLKDHPNQAISMVAHLC